MLGHTVSVQLGSNATTPLGSIAGAPPGATVQTAMQAVDETLPSRLSAPVHVTITATTVAA